MIIHKLRFCAFVSSWRLLTLHYLVMSLRIQNNKWKWHFNSLSWSSFFFHIDINMVKGQHQKPYTLMHHSLPNSLAGWKPPDNELTALGLKLNPWLHKVVPLAMTKCINKPHAYAQHKHIEAFTNNYAYINIDEFEVGKSFLINILSFRNLILEKNNS